MELLCENHKGEERHEHSPAKLGTAACCSKGMELLGDEVELDLAQHNRNGSSAHGQFHAFLAIPTGTYSELMEKLVTMFNNYTAWSIRDLPSESDENGCRLKGVETK